MSDGCNYFEFTDPGDSFQSWMGLRGPAGPAGAPGPQGPPGPQGEPGEVTEQELASVMATKAGILRDTASGAIATFVPDTTVPELLGVSVNVEPKQAGSGDPSPENVRPISGWDAVTVYGIWRNLADDAQYEPGYWNDNGNPASSNATQRTVNYIPVIGGGKYLYYFVSNASQRFRVHVYDANHTWLRQLVSTNDFIGTFTAPDNAAYIRWSLPNNVADFCIGMDNSHVIQLGQTVYGGALDVTAGTMRARPYYPSYNGESLVGPWVSSMDVYIPGSTPTTGAQVVDMGGAETQIPLTPTQIAAITGQTNNLWADAGPVSVEYAADLKTYIDKKITELQALVLENGG